MCGLIMEPSTAEIDYCLYTHLFNICHYVIIHETGYRSGAQAEPDESLDECRSLWWYLSLVSSEWVQSVIRVPVTMRIQHQLEHQPRIHRMIIYLFQLIVPSSAVSWHREPIVVCNMTRELVRMQSNNRNA